MSLLLSLWRKVLTKACLSVPASFWSGTEDKGHPTADYQHGTPYAPQRESLLFLICIGWTLLMKPIFSSTMLEFQYEAMEKLLPSSLDLALQSCTQFIILWYLTSAPICRLLHGIGVDVLASLSKHGRHIMKRLARVSGRTAILSTFAYLLAPTLASSVTGSEGHSSTPKNPWILDLISITIGILLWLALTYVP